MTILPADTYFVINKTVLSMNDRKVLNMLYQPLIGVEAVGLYFSFCSDLDKQEIISDVQTHYHLSKIMGLTLKEVLEAREKLEAMGLIKTFYKKDSVNSYIYELYSPVSAYEFFNHPIFNITLYNNVGKIEYDKLVKYFSFPKINKSDFEEITKKFSDIYEGAPKNDSISEMCNIRSINALNINIDSKVDFDLIISNLDGIISEKNLNDNMKDLIRSIAFIYGLDSYELCGILRNSFSNNGVINKEEFRKQARNYYQFENNGKLPYLIYRNQPEYLRNPVGDTSKRARMVYTFETITPYELLKSKSGGVEPISRDLKLVEDLMVDMKLKPGVVNVLIDYVLKINNNKLTKNFVETIAAQWKRLKVDTVSDAMEAAEKEYKKYRKNSKLTTKEEVKKPIWFDEEIKSSEASEAEIKELEDMLNGLN